MLRSIGSVTFLALLMVGCGGGDGGGSGGSGGGGSLTTYSIGGTVTGLTGSGLVLQTNAGDVAPVSKAGAFTFPNALGSGAAYTVTVKTQPSTPAQNCVVTNGSGTVGTANITTWLSLVRLWRVTRSAARSQVWLAPDWYCKPMQVILPSVSKAGAFTFPNQLGGGAAYTVTVKTQPSAPAQNCVVTNGTGTVGAANITDVAVACSAAGTYTGTYTVGGTVSGLVGSGLTLAICIHHFRGGWSCHNPKQIGANGTFTLGTVISHAGYRAPTTSSIMPAAFFTYAGLRDQ